MKKQTIRALEQRINTLLTGQTIIIGQMAYFARRRTLDDFDIYGLSADAHKLGVINGYLVGHIKEQKWIISNDEA